VAKKHLSVLKRARQNVKRRLRNKAIKSEIKTYYKNTIAALKEKNFALAEELVKKFVSRVDKAVKKNIIHLNTGNRKKSRLMRILAAAKQQGGQQNEKRGDNRYNL